MSPVPDTGFLLIADLTGYTAYLARGELEHAPVIAGDLLETIVGRLEPPFRFAKFEGDAAFLFVEDGRAEPTLLLDAIEAAYVAFRRRLRSLEAATTCTCNACGLAPRLDLKVFLHHGRYLQGQIAGRDELAGSDVILVHRLLKGTSAAATHPGGFCLMTADAAGALGVDPASLGMVRTRDAIEGLGEVTTLTFDLEAAWQAESRRQRLDGGDQPVLVDLVATLPAEPSAVWAHLTSPALRSRWEGPLRIDEVSPGGRRGVGTVAQCVTGRLATLEEIVDWQPYDHVGWRLAIPEVGQIEATADLSAVGGGTTIRLRWTSAGGDVDDRTRDRLRRERAAAVGRLVNLLGKGHGSRQQGGIA